MVELSDDARPDIGPPVKELLLDLELDDFAAFFNDQNFFETFSKAPHAFGFQRPWHPNFIDAHPDGSGFCFANPKLAQRLAGVLIGLAGGDDSEPRVRRVHDDLVDLVCSAKGNCRIAFLGLQSVVLFPTVIGPTNIETIGGHLKIGRNREDAILACEINGRRGLNRIGDHLHADPTTGVARHCYAKQTHLDELMDRRRVKRRDHRGREKMLGLVRYGRRFGRVIVARQRENPAMGCGSCGIAVLEGVARTRNAGALAVPDADDAIVFRTRRQMCLLRSPNSGCSEVFVNAGLEDDVVLAEALFLAHQDLIVPANGRAAIPGDKGCGIQPCRAVASHLDKGQAGQRMQTVHKDAAMF